MLKRAGASKAAPSTQCQKCLKRGHYSYECTGSQQDRPYASRPSRTQQLLNPKLAPKLSNAKLVELVPSIPDLKKEEWQEKVVRSKAPSVSSSDSVATISTSPSRSPTPPRRAVNRPRISRSDSPKHSSSRERSQEVRSRRRSPSPRQTYRRADKIDRDRSRSPYRSDRQEGHKSAIRDTLQPSSSRQRSLSPYSKRQALR
ncbi:hypothetical protein AMS68_002898 [Peltaster fructicola]|uniref:Zinc knuckle-domain-containing protein n=1 Tax=Peltaster fructicola TaxID=286661 RepID=A0A6H0XRU9_9PEZI|nr:hypothetical protein AMS68_002898 [Peltaster fructicola]